MDTAHVIRLLEPRDESTGITTTLSHFERGIAGGTHVHAARKTLNGYRAVCTPGLVVTRLGGRFDPASEESCPACVIACAE